MIMSGRFTVTKGLYPHSPATLGNVFKRILLSKLYTNYMKLFILYNKNLIGINFDGLLVNNGLVNMISMC